MKRFLVFVLLFTSITARAQVPPGKPFTDSLIALLPALQEDTSGVNLLIAIAEATYNAKPDTALKYANRAIALAQKTGWKQGAGDAYNSAGNCYQRKAAFPQALECLLHALRIFEELGNSRQTGVVAGNVGTVYFAQQNYNKALEYFTKSLNSAQATGNKSSEQQAYGNIGNVYYKQQRFPEALTYLQQSLHLATELGNTRGILSQMNSLGNVYGAMGENEEALNWYFKSQALAKSVGEQQIVVANEGNIGETYLDIAKDPATPRAYRVANIEKAITYLQRGIVEARQISYTMATLDFLKTITEAYTLRDNYKAAFTAYQQYIALKDSTFNIDNERKIAKLETERELALKDKDIEIAKLNIAKTRNERIGFIAGIGLLLCILGILFRSFYRQKHSNQLLSKEKRRSDDLLLNILPAEVAEELKDGHTSVARQYDEVTVLFTDFVNFTGTAEQLSPTQLVQELHECFTAFDAIMEKNGLEKIKTIGDAYLAVCGLPAKDPQHAQKVVQAALDVRDFIEERARQEKVFRIRIGVSSGPVVAGIVGVKKFAYDIWGDTVNTAARMESNSEPGKINISGATYELVKNNFAAHYRGQIEAKGKGAVAMYFVTASST